MINIIGYLNKIIYFCIKLLLVKKVYSILMAFLLTILVLFSSSFVLIDQHYCCGKIENFSLFGKAEKCDMATPHCEVEGQILSVSAESCCLNVADFKAVSIFKNSAPIKIDFQQPLFYLSNNIFNINQYVSLANNLSHFKNYSPPLITKDILVFVQCFRI